MSSSQTEFEQLNQESPTGVIREFWQFIVENKSWWMIPIIVVFSVFGVLIGLAGTGLLPFLYAGF